MPEAVREVLGHLLTEAGLRQWWSGRSRYLGGKRPAAVPLDAALSAARGFGSGVHW